MGYFGRPARRGAIMMALAACVALAVADNRYRGIADQDARAMDETTGSSPRDNHAPAELALSDEQRGRIYDGVMGIADAPVAQAPAPRLLMHFLPECRCRICPPPSPVTFRSCRGTNS